MKLNTLINYCDELLNIANYQDYAPNGLQVEGRENVFKMVTGVTASQALIDEAIKHQADAILVHHGYFWKNEPAVITGMKQRRIKTLLEHNISLIGYHLPLDGHETLGNNALLGKLWGLKDITPEEKSLVRLGVLKEPLLVRKFSQQVSESLNRKVLHLPGGPKKVQKIAWCSGGAQGYIEKAIAWNADVYISGEVSEQTFHQSLENNIHYFSAGHHATERLGVQQLGRHLSKQFDMEVVFIDVYNPV